MKRTCLITLLALLAIAPAAALAHDTDRGRWHGQGGKHNAWHHPGKHQTNRFERRFERRQARQFHRIREGRRSGDLTRAESQRLRKQQYRIERKLERYTSDGRLTPGERRRLDKAQDRASRAIARSRHNDHYRQRPGHERYAHGDGVALFWRYLN